MSTGLVFVTAPNADPRVINRFLLYVRDWEFAGPDVSDSFHLALSKTDPESDKFKDGKDDKLSVTKPGDINADDFTNDWAGESVQTIEQYAIEADEVVLFLLLDEQGIRDRTCIIANKHSEWDEKNPPERLPKERREAKHDFNKYRVPWDEVYLVYANLNISNMDFADYADEGEGPDEEGWWTFQGHGPMISEENVERREKEVRRFEEEGKL